MEIERAFKFRLYPTGDQKTLLSKTFGCKRFIWNAMLDERGSYYHEHGKGIGRALLDRALAEAERNKRIIKVRLYVNAQQRTAVRMYERAGFVTAGRLEREMKVGRRLYDMLVMEKTLS